MADVLENKGSDDGSDEKNPDVNLAPDMIEQLKEVFGVFDASGDGSIDCDELKSILECVQGREFDLNEVK